MLKGLGPRRATCDVDIYRDDLIQALNDTVNVIHPAGIAAGPHGDHPFGFGHLFIES
jgi:hypothetical protein